MGSNTTSGAIIQSYVTGSVSGTNTVGGLVGTSNGTVTRSYATGTVNGSQSVGGLVGAKQHPRHG